MTTTPACQTAPSATQQPLPTSAAIEAEVRRLMASEDVKGMALAVIDNGKVVHVSAHGVRNLEKNLPLQIDTVMYGASLTKAVVAYYLLQLVDEKRVGLDAPFAAGLPKPLPDYEDYGDLKTDPRWRALTPRIVLSHQTGFANFRWLDPDQKLRFHRDPGTRYGYSGEGFYVLQTYLEDGIGLDLGAEVQRHLFDRFGLKNTSLIWRADFAQNLADGYRADGSLEVHDERSSVSAAGSMDTTIADQARLWAAMVLGEDLSPASRAEWVRPQVAIDSAGQFPSLRDDRDPRGPAIHLAAGLGVIVFDGPQGRVFFKGGHNDSTGNMVVCVETTRRCLVLLANSVTAERIYPALTKFILGETGMPWWWEYGEQ